MNTSYRTLTLKKNRTIGLLAALGILGLHGVTPLAGLSAAQAQVYYGSVQYGEQKWPYESNADAAAVAMGFSSEARQSVKWSTAILNAYTGDEAWLGAAPAVPVQGSPAGFQVRPAGDAQRKVASQATRDFLMSLRFNKARTIYDADATWRRVMSGAVAGLMHAKVQNDVAAAHNVLGAALYASQNFYMNTNWLDDEQRRRLTYFEMPGSDRQKVPLTSYAGSAPNRPVALALANRQCIQTLMALEDAMTKAGAAEFWKKVKTDGVTQADRERQYEEFGRMPHLFLSSWTDPAPSGDTWLRLRLKTSKDANSGTNANIVVKTGGRDYKIDWLPTSSGVGSPYDDFEAGNDDAYWLGPFSTLPTEIQLNNNAQPGLVTIPFLPAITITNALFLAFKPLQMIVNNPPDVVKHAEKVWPVNGLKTLLNGVQPFSLDLDGKDEGYYRVHGTIERTGEDSTYYYAKIRLNRLDCVRESKIDGLSSSDEPFLLVAVAGMGSPLQFWRTEPFSDVDTGETRPLDARWDDIKIHKLGGGLSVGIQCWESDGESKETRDEMLKKFDSKMTEFFSTEYDQFMASLPATISETFSTDWKLEQMEVTAFTRGGGMQKFGSLYKARRTGGLKQGKKPRSRWPEVGPSGNSVSPAKIFSGFRPPRLRPRSVREFRRTFPPGQGNGRLPSEQSSLPK